MLQEDSKCSAIQMKENLQIGGGRRGGWTHKSAWEKFIQFSEKENIHPKLVIAGECLSID